MEDGLEQITELLRLGKRAAKENRFLLDSNVMNSSSQMMMDCSQSQPTQLSQSGLSKAQRLENMILDISIPEMKEMIKGVWNDLYQLDKQFTVDLVRVFWDGMTTSSSILTTSQANAIQLRRTALYTLCISLLNEGHSDERMANGILQHLLAEIDFIKECHIPSCVHTLLSTLALEETTSSSSNAVKFLSLELLPLFILRLLFKSTVSNSDGEDLHGMSGEMYKNHILNGLFIKKWSTMGTIAIIPLLHSIPMTKEQMKTLVEKIRRNLHVQNFKDLPALIYQILLFSGKLKNGNDKRIVLQGVVRELDAMENDAGAPSDATGSSGRIQLARTHLMSLRIALADVLAHFNFVAKQDRPVGTMLLHICKSLSAPGPFSMTLLLSLGTTPQYEAAVLEQLKQLIVSHFTVCDSIVVLPWLEYVRKWTNDDDHDPQTFNPQALLDIIAQMKYGWEHVLPCVIQLAIQLMDTENAKKPETKQVASFGITLLLELAKQHEQVQRPVVETLITTIVTPGSAVHLHLEALQSILATFPCAAESSLDRIRGTMEYITFLTLPTARGLLQATTTLWTRHSDLKDHIILILRKAVFSKEESKRLIAAQGFLILVKGLLVPSSSSTRRLEDTMGSQFSQSSGMIYVTIYYIIILTVSSPLVLYE